MHDVAATVDRVREIVRSMAESADSTREMTANLGSVSAAIGETDAAGRMTSSAALIGTRIETLRTEALRFTAQLKAAG